MPSEKKKNNVQQGNSNPRRLLNKKFVFIVAVIVLILFICIAVYLYLGAQKTKQNSDATANTAPLTYSTDPLSANRATGETLTTEVTQLKDQAAKLNEEIKATQPPKSKDEELALAKKYLKLADLYIQSFNYAEAANALSMIYNPSVLSTANLIADKTIDMEAQALFGLLFYNTGQYNSSIDAYNRAILIAGSTYPENNTPFNADKLKKYNEALVLVKKKQ